MNKKKIFSIFLMCALILGSASGLAIAEDNDDITAPQVEVGLPGTVFRYEQTLGETGVPYLIDSDHLNAPRGLGLDAADNLWVAEADGARAIKFAPDYSSPMYIGQAGFVYLADETHFARPADVAVAGDGSVWVVDNESNRVVKFDASGNYLTQLGVTWEAGDDNAHLDHPFSVALDSTGNIYVSDTWNERVQVLESNGFYHATLGVTDEPGSDNDHFSSPTGITIDDSDYLYVADINNDRVQIFDENHSYVATISSDAPRAVAVDADFIYIVEVYNHRVQIYNRTAPYELRATLGGYGSGDYEFDTPLDVGLDSTGHLYVLDAFNYRVQKYAFDHTDLTFTYWHTYGTTDVPYATDGYHYNQPYDVEVDAAGNIAIVEDWGRGQRLIVLDPNGVHKFTIGEAGLSGGDNEHFADPLGVAFDTDGYIYVADCGNNRVQIFDSTGMWVFTLGGTWGTGEKEFKCPSGVAVDSNGQVYVADHDNQRVQIYDDRNTGFEYLNTLGVTGVPGSDNSHFDAPAGLEVDTSGNIYVADRGNHRVQKYNSNLEWQMTLGITGECGYDFDHFCEPFGVAVDTAGNIYVAEKFSHRVQVFDSNGAYLTTIAGAISDQTGGLRETYGLDVDSAGNVYIADLYNHRVQVFAPGVPGWEQINVNGFGVRATRGVPALEVFEGQLYAGTANWEDSGGRVWRSADGLNWEPASEIGFGMGSVNPAVIDLIEFEGQLYAGTGWNGAAGQVWRTVDGTTWEAVTTDGFGDGGNHSVASFAIFDDMLYAATGNSNGAQIWRSSSGRAGTWAKVAPDDTGTQPGTLVTGFAVFEGALYAAVEDGVPAQVWRSTDGSMWTTVVADGFGDEDNHSPGGFAEFGDYLYLGVWNDVTGGQLWRTENGTLWTQVVGDGFGDIHNVKIESLFRFDGYLYAVTHNSETGVEVWRMDETSEWEQVYPVGFGDSNNFLSLWSNAITVFECRLTIGTWNDANGSEVWSMLEDKQLCVDKNGPDSAYYNQQATYQMAVTYSSLDGSAAKNISVEDDVFGAAAYVSGDTNGDEYLDVSETWLYQVSGVPGDVGIDPIVNVATVNGQDMEGIDLTPATDTHSTEMNQVFLPLARRD